MQMDYLAQDRRVGWLEALDLPLLFCALALLCLGLVMITSASMEYSLERYKDALLFGRRHTAHIGVALVGAMIAFMLPSAFWRRLGVVMMPLGLLALALTLVPGIGREVNGSWRWLSLGGVSVQTSEIIKFAMLVYLADFLVRRRNQLRREYLAPLGPITLLTLMFVLLLLEPDFGTAMLLLCSAFGLLFLGGTRLLLFVGAGLALTLGGVYLALSAPYRLARLLAFRDPWADPLGIGYQLSHSLIAFGRGGWFGEGLGHSVQKQLYLPEAHTDFVFAIIGEELGLFGGLLTLGLFVALFARTARLGWLAERRGHLFGAYFAYGVTILLAGQAFINMAVNIGALPTKGLTLPLVSYGGSSMVISCALLAAVLRIGFEVRREAGRYA